MRRSTPFRIGFLGVVSCLVLVFGMLISTGTASAHTASAHTASAHTAVSAHTASWDCDSASDDCGGNGCGDNCGGNNCGDNCGGNNCGYYNNCCNSGCDYHYGHHHDDEGD